MNAYTFELEAAVNASLKSTYLRIGNQVELVVRQRRPARWKGTVSRISDVVDPATQTIKVFINVSGKDLKEGMYLSATVTGKKIL